MRIQVLSIDLIGLIKLVHRLGRIDKTYTPTQSDY